MEPWYPTRVGAAKGRLDGVSVRRHLRAVAQRKRYLFVCENRREDGVPKGSCAARGGTEVGKALKEGSKARGLAKLEVRVCRTSCLDVCWAGPVISVMPDGYFYGRVTMADVPEILDALSRGERVERLVLPSGDFDEGTAGPALPLPPKPAEPAP